MVINLVNLGNISIWESIQVIWMRTLGGIQKLLSTQALFSLNPSQSMGRWRRCSLYITRQQLSGCKLSEGLFGELSCSSTFKYNKGTNLNLNDDENAWNDPGPFLLK